MTLTDETRSGVRKGLVTAGMGVVLFTIAAVVLNGWAYLQCTTTGDCDPFGGQSMGDRVEQGVEHAKAIGTGTQFLYGVQLEEGTNLPPAVRKYAWCREGPGTVGEYRCTGTPEESAITGAVEGFTPYPQRIVNLIPFFNTFNYRFTIEQAGKGDDGVLLEAGSGNPTDSPSTFLFAVPLAGGENVRLRLVMNKGRITVGVVTD